MTFLASVVVYYASFCQFLLAGLWRGFLLTAPLVLAAAIAFFCIPRALSLFMDVAARAELFTFALSTCRSTGKYSPWQQCHKPTWSLSSVYRWAFTFPVCVYADAADLWRSFNKRLNNPGRYRYRPCLFSAYLHSLLFDLLIEYTADVKVPTQRVFSKWWFQCWRLFHAAMDYPLYPVHLFLWMYRGGDFKSQRAYWSRPHYTRDMSGLYRAYFLESIETGQFWGLRPMLPETLFEGIPFLEKLLPRYAFIGRSNKRTVKLVSQLLLFAANASQCATWEAVLLLLPLALNGVLEDGVICALVDYSRSIAVPMMQDGLWADFKSAVAHWREARDSPFVKRFENLMYAGVAAGLLSVAGIPVTQTVLDHAVRHSKDLRDKPITDFTLYIAESIIHFVDCSAHYLSKDGSFRSFFMRSQDATQLDEDYNYLVANSELFYNGSLEKIASSEAEYLGKLELTRKAFALMASKASLGQIERNVLNQRALRVEQLAASIMLRSNQQTMRVAPFVVKLASTTAQGKSVFVDEMQAHLLRVNNLPTSREYCATINENDKFDSTVKSNTVVIRMDDFPKLRPELGSTSPVDTVMRIANNELTAAVKAELDQKGVVFFNNRLLLITTNIPKLYCEVTAAEPAAVMRRIDVHASFTVRPEFRNHLGHLDSARVNAEADRLGHSPDIHLVDVMEYRTEGNVPNLYPKTFTWPTRYTQDFGYPDVTETLTGLSTIKFLHYLTVKSQAHFAHQERLMDRTGRIFNDTTCPTCQVGTLRCPCPVPLAPQSTGAAIRSRVSSGLTYVLQVRAYMSSGTRWYWLHMARLHVHVWSTTFAERATKYLMANVAKFALVVALCDWVATHSRAFSIWQYSTALGFFLSFYATWVWSCWHLLTALAFLLLYGGSVWLQYYCDGIYLAHRGFFWAREFGASRLLRWFAAFVGCAIAYRTYSAYAKPAWQVQGSAPSAPTDYRPWEAFANARRVPEHLLTTVPEQTVDVVSRSVAHLSLHMSNGKVRKGNGLVVKTNFLVTNAHSLALPDGVSGYVSLSFGPDRWGANMSHVDISPELVEPVLNPDGSPTDLVVVHLQGGGARRDLTEYMSTSPLQPARPGGETRHLRGIELYRPIGSEVERVNTSFRPVRASGLLGERVMSLEQQRPSPTFPGLCGAVALTVEGGKTVISGLHYLGDGQCGMSTQVTGPWISDAIGRLLSRSPFLGAGAERPLKPETFTGSTHSYVGTVHYKSGAHNLSPEARVNVLGSTTIPRVIPRSNIVDLPMKDSVLRHCPDVKVTHEPPSTISDPRIFTDNLLKRTDSPVLPLPAAHFDLAFRDLLLHDKRVTDGKLDQVRPLSFMEMFTGREGQKGIEPLDLKTSMGLPYRKKKALYMSRQDAEGPGLPPVAVDEEIIDNFRRIDARMRLGERVGLLFDASAKDEQVKIGKKKTRIITGINIYLSLAFRKYVLPVMALEADDTASHEHGVWTRPASSEWGALAERLLSHGKDRLVVGDYGDFDSRTLYQLVRAGMRLYELRAERCPHYTHADRVAFGVVCEEVCNAFAEFNGTIYEFWGTVLSGHNGTVMLNNVVNRLLLRTAFFGTLLESDAALAGDTSSESVSTASDFSAEELPPKLRAVYDRLDGCTFADLVVVVAYGDDLVGAVSSRVTWFNAQTIHEYLGRYGYLFTDANKMRPDRGFYTLEEVDFIKRRFRWDEELGRYAAPLAWTSITKCLLAGMPPKPSTGKDLPEHCSDLIKSQLAEVFEYGRVPYDNFAAQMQKVVEEMDYACYFPAGVVRTFDEQNEVWCLRDAGLLVDEGVVDTTAYEAQCGLEDLARIAVFERLGGRPLAELKAYLDRFYPREAWVWRLFVKIGPDTFACAPPTPVETTAYVVAKWFVARRRNSDETVYIQTGGFVACGTRARVTARWFIARVPRPTQLIRDAPDGAYAMVYLR